MSWCANTSSTSILTCCLLLSYEQEQCSHVTQGIAGHAALSLWFTYLIRDSLGCWVLLRIPALSSTALLLLMGALGRLVVPLDHLPPSFLGRSPALRFCSQLLGDFLKHDPCLGWNHLIQFSRNLYEWIVFSGLKWYVLWVANLGSNLTCTCGLDARVSHVRDSLEDVKMLSPWKLARGSCLCLYTPIKPELNGAW